MEDMMNKPHRKFTFRPYLTTLTFILTFTLAAQSQNSGCFGMCFWRINQVKKKDFINFRCKAFAIARLHDGLMPQLLRAVQRSRWLLDRLPGSMPTLSTFRAVGAREMGVETKKDRQKCLSYFCIALDCFKNECGRAGRPGRVPEPLASHQPRG